MKRISVLFTFLLATLCSFAQIVEVEGVVYNIDPATKTESTLRYAGHES